MNKNKKINFSYKYLLFLIIGIIGLSFIIFKISKTEKLDSSRVAKTGYKIININNPDVQFSFEIPEKWLIETRNSGEKVLSNSEKREYLSTKCTDKPDDDYACYFDNSISELRKLSNEEIDNKFNKISDFAPNVSVNGGNAIWYADINSTQIDFKIINKSIMELLNKENVGSKVLSKVIIDNKNVEVLSTKTNIDNNGSDSKEYFIEIPKSGKTFKITKQAKGNEQFEKDFENLIQSLKINFN